MNRVCLRPVGAVVEEDLAAIEAGLENRFGIPIEKLPPLPEPDGSFDSRRQQYSSVNIVKELLDTCPEDAAKLIGVTERDLFIPMLSFVFGQAQLGGRIALVSLARLRQEFYELPSDRAVFLDRAVKECVHELGHTLGLLHCTDRRCPMSLSTDIRQVDAKTADFCSACEPRARKALWRATEMSK